FQLGAALGRLGQVDQACVTLGEVEVRFPGSPAVARAAQEMTALGCS
ncbi:tol-pal system protein, partial [Cribrihabitans sp. XS_ASV171]